MTVPATWGLYATCIHCFLTANQITEADLKIEMFLSICDAATFELAQDLLMPQKIKVATFDRIMEALQQHFALQLAEIAWWQGPTETIAAYVAAL